MTASPAKMATTSGSPLPKEESLEAVDLFRTWRGPDGDVEPLLRRRGLN